MDNRVYDVVVVPTLLLGSSFIGITTLGEEDNAGVTNFVSELIELKNKEGEKIMNVVDFKMACRKCIRAGTEATCSHKNGEIPHFHDRSRSETVEAIFQNNPDTFLREIR